MAYSSEHVRTSVKSSVHQKELLYSMNSKFFLLRTVCCTGWSVLFVLPFERLDYQELMITVSKRQTPPLIQLHFQLLYVYPK